MGLYNSNGSSHKSNGSSLNERPQLLTPLMFSTEVNRCMQSLVNNFECKAVVTFFSSFVLMKPSLSRSKILKASLIVSASSSCKKSKRISAKDAKT